jgi:hypothetical protein
MNKLLSILSCIALLFALAGCVSPLMTEVRSLEILPPPLDKVKVVFMRRTIFRGDGLGADLFEVIDGDLKFVGALAAGTKIVYETTPGQENVFMAVSHVEVSREGSEINDVSGAADFMLGKLAGGKIYYSVVSLGYRNMIPRPVKVNANEREVSMATPEFASWVKDTKLIAPKAEAKDWFSQRKDQYQKIYKDYWARFQRKTPAEKAERTLNPEDGVLK